MFQTSSSAIQGIILTAYLVLKMLFLILSNHELCTSLYVRAVERVVYVKPISILTLALMSKFFGGQEFPHFQAS